MDIYKNQNEVMQPLFSDANKNSSLKVRPLNDSTDEREDTRRIMKKNESNKHEVSKYPSGPYRQEKKMKYPSYNDYPD